MSGRGTILGEGVLSLDTAARGTAALVQPVPVVAQTVQEAQ